MKYLEELVELANNLHFFINVVSSDEDDRNEIWTYFAPNILPPE